MFIKNIFFYINIKMIMDIILFLKKTLGQDIFISFVMIVVLLIECVDYLFQFRLVQKVILKLQIWDLIREKFLKRRDLEYLRYKIDREYGILLEKRL